MTASATGVESSEDAVELPFRHRLVGLKINLAPGKGENAEDMCKAVPRIAATGFYIQAEYDLEDNTIGNLGERADILASGTWKVADGQLTGKEIIVLSHRPGRQILLIPYTFSPLSLCLSFQSLSLLSLFKPFHIPVELQKYSIRNRRNPRMPPFDKLYNQFATSLPFLLPQLSALFTICQYLGN